MSVTSKAILNYSSARAYASHHVKDFAGLLAVVPLIYDGLKHVPAREALHAAAI